jgi:uncharacterized protein (TIGR02117 family)
MPPAQPQAMAQAVRRVPVSAGGALSGRMMQLLLLCLCLAACRTVPPGESLPATAAPPVTVYVVRRGWHVDLGVAVRDLEPSLQPLASAFAGAQYLLFGFGDRRYLLKRGTGNLFLALWPGRGVILVTSLRQEPEQAFERGDVLALPVTVTQLRQLQSFIRASLYPSEGLPRRVAAGPYAESAYYDSRRTYSAFHTCNTWAAQALQAAGLPVHSTGVEFTGQLWMQVRELDRTPAR